MKKSDQLKASKADKLEAQKRMIEARDASENKQFTEDETKQFRTLTSEIDTLETQIKNAVEDERAEARIASLGGEPVSAPVIVGSKRQEAPSLLKALRSMAEGDSLGEAEAQIHEEGVQELRSQGLSVPSKSFVIPASATRAQTVTGDSGAKGAAAVATTPKLVMPLQPVVAIESLGVNVMPGLVGNVTLPTSGSFSFSYVAENADVAGTDIGFAGPTLSPKRCAGVVEVSEQLLAQSSFDIEAYLIKQINIAYGNAITSNAINGAGGVAPTGLIDLITTNIDTTAGVPTYDTVVALEGLVDDADGTSVSRAYLSDMKLRAKMKTTKVDAGSGVFLTDGKELNGSKYMANTLVPVLATDKHPLIFGDWNQLNVGYWNSISIKVDPYTKSSAGMIRLIINGYSDVAVSNEKAFAINKVMTIA